MRMVSTTRMASVNAHGERQVACERQRALRAPTRVASERHCPGRSTAILSLLPSPRPPFPLPFPLPLPIPVLCPSPYAYRSCASCNCRCRAIAAGSGGGGAVSSASSMLVKMTSPSAPRRLPPPPPPPPPPPSRRLSSFLFISFNRLSIVEGPLADVESETEGRLNVTWKRAGLGKKGGQGRRAYVGGGR